jgi:hypothetical protein
MRTMLDAEVRWMRSWIQISSEITDEENAWKALGEFQRALARI